MIEQVDARVPWSDHQNAGTSQVSYVAELPGVDEAAWEARHPWPVRQHGLGIWSGRDHDVRRGDAAAVAQLKFPSRVYPIVPFGSCT